MDSFETLSDGEVEDMVAVSGLEREDLKELGADLKLQYESTIAKVDETSALEMAKLELLDMSMTQLKTNMKYMDKETQDLIRNTTQKVLNSVKELDQSIMGLADQMNSVRTELVTAINLGALQAVYHEDFDNFDLISRKFEELERGGSGTLVNNRDVEEFKEVVDNHWNGAEQTYINIHKMIVGNKRLKQKPIFEIDHPAFCGSKDYFLFAMHKLFQFDATSEAMDGRSIDAVQSERFKVMQLEIEEKHIETCGCPTEQTPERMSNLHLLISQPTPQTSGELTTCKLRKL